MCIQGSIIVLEFPDDPTTDLFVGSKHHYKLQLLLFTLLIIYGCVTGNHAMMKQLDMIDSKMGN